MQISTGVKAHSDWLSLAPRQEESLWTNLRVSFVPSTVWYFPKQLSWFYVENHSSTLETHNMWAKVGKKMKWRWDAILLSVHSISNCRC